ncbi:MAG: ABC transporter permease [Anaerolineales bacterium]|nr:ABC transporter permease [Anaerolineales bacterium]
MAKLIIRRLIVAVPTLFLFSLLVFSLMHLAPGDPTLLYTGKIVSKEVYERTRAQLGLDEPLYIQYGKFVTNLLHGNLGRSHNYRIDVLELLKLRVPNSVILGASAMLLTYIISVPLGVLAAIKQKSAVDMIVLAIIALGMSIPLFWLGLMLILLFSVRLRWFPVSGYDSLHHMILPVVTLSAVQISYVMRMTRSSMLEVLRQDYVRTASAKGLKMKTVIWKHAFRNALIPLISIFGMQIGWLAAGAVVIEMVFVWPGIGRLIVESIIRSDYPVIQGVLLMLGATVILGNLVADILYTIADPKIRL